MHPGKAFRVFKNKSRAVASKQHPAGWILCCTWITTGAPSAGAALLQAVKKWRPLQGQPKKHSPV